MGSKARLSSQETAELLGVSVAQVRVLVRQGYLTPYYDQSKRLNASRTFDRDEVYALAEVRDTEKGQRKLDMQRMMTIAVQALAKAKQLERRLESLEQALGRSAWPLPMDEESLIRLYTRATEDSDKPAYTDDEVLDWSKVLLALGTEVFDSIEAQTEDTDCWKPFLELTDSMLTRAPHDKLEYDIELKSIYSYLDAGKRNLQHVIFLYLQRRFGVQAASKAFDVGYDGHRDVLALLAMHR